MTTTAATLDAHLAATREKRLARYLDLLRIPSISALPEHAADCRAAAEWIAARMREIGLEHVEVSDTGGPPIVYADWLHAEGAPTAVAYAHYDVQPVDPLDEWRHPPFEPVVEGDRVLARGASDDKSSVAILLDAVEAMLATEGRLPINLRFALEGEEESTSEHLEPWLVANRDRLGGDVALITDNGFFAGNIPAITVSLRGIMYAQIDVRGPFQDVHSGVYGGSIANPVNALATILASLKDADGRIAIPGFYDSVVELSTVERQTMAELPFDERAFADSLEAPALVGEIGYTTLERKSVRPTLDVNGIWGGFQGEGSKTIIPGSAHAKVSSRLVADQDPEEIFRLFKAHVERNAPPGVTVTTRSLGNGKPSSISIDHPTTQAYARALERAFGRAPVYQREGGSIPFVATFVETLGLPAVLSGFTPPDGNFHAPNEWMDLGNYENGVRAMVFMFDELAAMDGRGA
jgi:acetylornithine deacetylase/succinyl-diaminopimelate desuccinylase-like protein